MYKSETTELVVDEDAMQELQRRVKQEQEQYQRWLLYGYLI